MQAKLRSDGSTASYYELPDGAAQIQDLISHQNMNAQIERYSVPATGMGRLNTARCFGTQGRYCSMLKPRLTAYSL